MIYRRLHLWQISMYSPHVIVKPASLWTINKVCDDIECFWMLDFGIDDVGNSIVAEIDLWNIISTLT